MGEGIHAIKFLGQADAFDARLAHGFGGLVVHLALEPDKTPLGARKLVIELLGLLTKNGAKSVGHLQKVFYFLRIGIDGQSLDAARQHLSVAVQNHAATPGHQLRRRMLAFGLVGQTRPGNHLQVPGAPPQPQPENAEKHHDDIDTGTAPVHTIKQTAEKPSPNTDFFRAALPVQQLVGRRSGSGGGHRPVAIALARTAPQGKLEHIFSLPINRKGPADVGVTQRRRRAGKAPPARRCRRDGLPCGTKRLEILYLSPMRRT